MNIAITVWGNRVSPVFDSAQTIMLIEVEDELVLSRKREFMANTIPATLAHMLVGQGIDTLICGAISEQPARVIEGAGINLISFVAGNIERVLQAYICGISIKDFMMPGCSGLCCRQNRGFNSRHNAPHSRKRQGLKARKTLTEVTSCRNSIKTQE